MFFPRPNQPQRHDEQSAFFGSTLPGTTFLLGGNGAGTTTTALIKMVDFLQKTLPPRKDTPFWIVAQTFEQSMNVCWKEKLHGQQMLPPVQIDWERIHWHKPRNDWPFSVPLKPPPGAPGRNWMLVFKSCEQGRGQMQGESIGGFLFVEQFPWNLLTEVVRGCRDYNFCGNKLAEFTPVDPVLSAPLQEMEEEGRLPPGWAIYRANTECAVEAGHVTEQWFDQFFGMIPQSMRDVRTKGLWGGYEGAVYPEFDPAIHCLPDSWDIPPNCHHRRMIDWGFGAENAFCCLFACRNGIGQWFVYDEYYSTNTSIDVIDHLKAIADMHPWPSHSPYYGVTWSDPSDANCLRIANSLPTHLPGYESFNCQLAKPDVQAGIQYIKRLLQCDPALALHPPLGVPPIVTRSVSEGVTGANSSIRGATDLESSTNPCLGSPSTEHSVHSTQSPSEAIVTRSVSEGVSLPSPLAGEGPGVRGASQDSQGANSGSPTSPYSVLSTPHPQGANTLPTQDIASTPTASPARTSTPNPGLLPPTPEVPVRWKSQYPLNRPKPPAPTIVEVEEEFLLFPGIKVTIGDDPTKRNSIPIVTRKKVSNPIEIRSVREGVKQTDVPITGATVLETPQTQVFSASTNTQLPIPNSQLCIASTPIASPPLGPSPQPLSPLPGQPHLFIVRSRCPNLVRQLRSYRRLRSNKSGLNPQNAPDAPLKADDHAVDALRYGLYSEAITTGFTPEAVGRKRNPSQFGVQGEIF